MELRLDIDSELKDRLSERAERLGFESVEQYSETILQTVIDEIEGHDEVSTMKKRLGDLGYLD